MQTTGYRDDERAAKQNRRREANRELTPGSCHHPRGWREGYCWRLGFGATSWKLEAKRACWGVEVFQNLEPQSSSICCWRESKRKHRGIALLLSPTSGSFGGTQTAGHWQGIAKNIVPCTRKQKKASWGMNMRINRQKTNTSIKEKRNWDFMTIGYKG